MPIERTKIRASLLGKGFKEKIGKHDYYYLYVEEKKTSVFTFLSQGSGYREYSNELVGRVAQQMRLTKKELLLFVECPLTHKQYVELLKQRNHIR